MEDHQHEAPTEVIEQKATEIKTEVREEGRKTRGFLHHPLRFVYLILFVIFVLLTGGSIIINKLARAIQKVQDQSSHIDEVTSNTNHILAVTSEENRKYFDTQRQLIIADNEKQRDALLNQLKGFTFSPIPSTTTTTARPRSSGATTTSVFAPKPTTTTTSKPPTTTTTQPPPTTTTTEPCVVTTPVANVCPRRG